MAKKSKDEASILPKGVETFDQLVEHLRWKDTPKWKFGFPWPWRLDRLLFAHPCKVLGCTERQMRGHVSELTGWVAFLAIISSLSAGIFGISFLFERRDGWYGPAFLFSLVLFAVAVYLFRIRTWLIHRKDLRGQFHRMKTWPAAKHLGLSMAEALDALEEFVNGGPLLARERELKERLKAHEKHAAPIQPEDIRFTPGPSPYRSIVEEVPSPTRMEAARIFIAKKLQSTQVRIGVLRGVLARLRIESNETRNMLDELATLEDSCRSLPELYTKAQEQKADIMTRVREIDGLLAGARRIAKERDGEADDAPIPGARIAPVDDPLAWADAAAADEEAEPPPASQKRRSLGS